MNAKFKLFTGSAPRTLSGYTKEEVVKINSLVKGTGVDAQGRVTYGNRIPKNIEESKKAYPDVTIEEAAQIYFETRAGNEFAAEIRNHLDSLLGKAKPKSNGTSSVATPTNF